MYGGKTSALISSGRRYIQAEKKVLFIKNAKDIRAPDSAIMTHDEVICVAIACENLFSLEKETNLLEYDVLLIDEGQFFPDLTSFCVKYADLGKKVYVAALCSTFEQKGWESINELIPKCDDIKFFKAVCKVCKCDNASKTKVNDISLIDPNKKENVGGKEKYSAVCRKCFN